MIFEPSPVWLDDNLMATDETAKVFLRNVLGKSKGQLRELKQSVDKKMTEVENVKRIRQSIREGNDKRDEVEVVRAIFAMQEDLHEIERKRFTAEVETVTITTAVGDVSLGAQNHSFKPQTFKIPTNCDLCGERIWGLSAKGFDCRDCGYTCHSKCEMKVPAECPGEQSKEEKKKLKADRQVMSNATPVSSNDVQPNGVSELPALSRSNTMNSLSSGYAVSANRSVSALPSRPANEESDLDAGVSKAAISKPTTARRNRIVAPPPAQYVSEATPAELDGASRSPTAQAIEPRGKMLYPYQAVGEGEVSVEEGQEVIVVEPDGKPLPFRDPRPQLTKYIRRLRLALSPLTVEYNWSCSCHIPRTTSCHRSGARQTNINLQLVFVHWNSWQQCDGQEEGSGRSAKTWC